MGKRVDIMYGSERDAESVADVLVMNEPDGVLVEGRHNEITGETDRIAAI